MEISNKYIVRDIPKTIVNHISAEWPRTLVEWNIRQKELESIPQSMHRTLPEPVAAIQFATIYDAPEILPAAFYQLCITPTESDWDATLLKEKPGILKLAARWSSLDATNAVRFAKGRDALLRNYFSNVLAMCSKSRTSKAYGQSQYCSCNFELLKSQVDSARSCYHHDCLKHLQTLTNMPGALCSECLTKNRQHFKDLQTQIWNRLPEFFGLPPPSAG